MIKEIIQETEQIEERINALSENEELLEENAEEIRELDKTRNDLLSKCTDLTAADRVYLARHPKRPHIKDFIDNLFTDFFEQKGDHLYDEDLSIYGGIARYKGCPVTVLGHQKGRTMEENLAYNFGMPRPEGYRKALRLMQQAEKFGRPIITFIDTPGAYPGLEAEEHGQGEAIARNLAAMSSFHVPVISIVTGEGNSGGALAIGVANKILMLENAVYSVLSPEGFASILWKDAGRHEEACEVMKLTARDLRKAGVADHVIPEPLGGAQEDPERLYASLDIVLEKTFTDLLKLSPEEVRKDRQEKYRNI
ncbi:acetyl-CoA carboxylase carboxyl transferase subunit alpha [Oribacterium sp. KHPX15]|uniref:acetyl-CoA carboxylase carboxyltransferase subunit alpha n=1 Tax=unclassified Oribacterium TaxID=2629782 RepID=UPI0004E23431|nr:MULTISPECIES: acetyl-CoA carboxylase carboxyltransferase subunit alpha [unclassified Oribacterium]SEA14989.1 acetyl-CoA carboxylase carboxyl transferase subunit alpha [Oribacterium sp. KHPX15]